MLPAFDDQGAVDHLILSGFEQQRRDQQPRHPAIELALTDAWVEPLGKLVGKGRVGHRINEAVEHLALVGDDVAIVDRHHRAVGAGNQIAHAAPDILSLARLLRGEPQRLEPAHDLQHARAVVPDHRGLLRQHGKELPRMAVLRLVGAIESDDDAMQVSDLLQLLQDVGQGIPLELGEQRGQDQRDLAALREGLELVDQLRVSIPQDISEADEVLRKREELLNQSLGEAKRIRASAETELRSRIGEAELVKEAEKEAQAIAEEAEEKAQQILDVAETQATTKRTSADRYAQEQLYKLEEEVNRLLGTVRNGIEVLEAQQKISG